MADPLYTPPAQELPAWYSYSIRPIATTTVVYSYATQLPSNQGAGYVATSVVRTEYETELLQLPITIEGSGNGNLGWPYVTSGASFADGMPVSVVGEDQVYSVNSEGARITPSPDTGLPSFSEGFSSVPLSPTSEPTGAIETNGENTSVTTVQSTPFTTGAPTSLITTNSDGSVATIVSFVTTFSDESLLTMISSTLPTSIIDRTTSGPAASDTASSRNSSSKLSHGKIAGVVIGSLVGALLVFLCCFCAFWKRRKRKTLFAEDENEKGHGNYHDDAEVDGFVFVNPPDTGPHERIQRNSNPSTFRGQHMSTFSAVSSVDEAGLKTPTESGLSSPVYSPVYSPRISSPLIGTVEDLASPSGNPSIQGQETPKPSFSVISGGKLNTSRDKDRGIYNIITGDDELQAGDIGTRRPQDTENPFDSSSSDPYGQDPIRFPSSTPPTQPNTGLMATLGGVLGGFSLGLWKNKSETKEENDNNLTQSPTIRRVYRGRSDGSGSSPRYSGSTNTKRISDSSSQELERSMRIARVPVPAMSENEAADLESPSAKRQSGGSGTKTSSTGTPERTPLMRSFTALSPAPLNFASRLSVEETEQMMPQRFLAREYTGFSISSVDEDHEGVAKRSQRATIEGSASSSLDTDGSYQTGLEVSRAASPEEDRTSSPLARIRPVSGAIKTSDADASGERGILDRLRSGGLGLSLGLPFAQTKKEPINTDMGPPIVSLTNPEGTTKTTGTTGTTNTSGTNNSSGSSSGPSNTHTSSTYTFTESDYPAGRVSQDQLEPSSPLRPFFPLGTPLRTRGDSSSIASFGTMGQPRRRDAEEDSAPGSLPNSPTARAFPHSPTSRSGPSPYPPSPGRVPLETVEERASQPSSQFRMSAMGGVGHGQVGQSVRRETSAADSVVSSKDSSMFTHGSRGESGHSGNSIGER